MVGINELKSSANKDEIALDSNQRSKPSNVPCCDVKNQGGDFEYSSKNSIVEDLSPENRTRLLQRRKRQVERVSH